MLCLPDRMTLFDPGPTLTEQRQVRLVDRWDDTVVGVAGWSTGGLAALGEAADHPELERLALISTPFVEQDLADVPIEAVAAKTLLLFGSDDPRTGSRHGRSWKKRLATARLEMVPEGGHDLLVPMWSRVLSHLTPGRAR